MACYFIKWTKDNFPCHSRKWDGWLQTLRLRIDKRKQIQNDLQRILRNNENGIEDLLVTLVEQPPRNDLSFVAHRISLLHMMPKIQQGWLVPIQCKRGRCENISWTKEHREYVKNGERKKERHRKKKERQKKRKKESSKVIIASWYKSLWSQKTAKDELFKKCQDPVHGRYTHTNTSLLRKGEQLENVKDIAKFITDYLILAQVHYPQYVKSIHTLLKIPSVSYCSVTSDYGYSFIF